jgi:hypothetical protein
LAAGRAIRLALVRLALVRLALVRLALVRLALVGLSLIGRLVLVPALLMAVRIPRRLLAHMPSLHGFLAALFQETH